MPSFSKPKDYADDVISPFEENFDVSNSYKGPKEPTPFAYVTPSFQTKVLDGQYDYDYNNHFNGTYYNILHRVREASKKNSQSTLTDNKTKGKLKEVIIEHNGHRIILEVEEDPFQAIHKAFNKTYNPDHFDYKEIVGKSQTKEPFEIHHTIENPNMASNQKTKEPFKMPQDTTISVGKHNISQAYNSKDMANKQRLKETFTTHQNEQETERTKDMVELEESTPKTDFVMTHKENLIVTTALPLQGSQTLKLKGC